MKAEIISIGDELLLGQVIDTNSAWIGQELNKLGINVHYKSTVGDSKEILLNALNQSAKRSDIIVMTGGLGPTKDDLTKHILCEFFDCGLVQNDKVLEWVQSIFAKRNLPMLQSNNEQALVPEKCDVLWNRNGTAPGMYFFENGKAFISMPGVPFEMKCIFEEEVIPKLKKDFSFPVIKHKTILTISIGESFLAKKIAPIEDNLPSHIKLAYLPSVGAVRLRLSAYDTNEAVLANELSSIVSSLYESIGEYIFGEEEETIAEVVGKLLTKNKQSIATCESCTGGYLAHMITSIAGSSQYYKGSILAYDNAVKTEVVGVNPAIIKTDGAVSEACVKEMAEHTRKLLKTDYALATSGIAGPGGGTETKPVGTVWIALATPTSCVAKCFNMGDHRGRTIERTALMALDMLRKELLQLHS
ncbi:MAG: competence/damage-inducible protein A [Bacteroidia bacterium]|nr:competence/damage-inducible protein A [Bacteroidia bacterium]